MKRLHFLPLAAAVLAGTVFAGTMARAADTPEASVPVLVGGITKDDEAAMQRQAHQWPMRLVFSERRDNEFVADVDVVVRDAKGREVLALDNTGPMTYAKLPPGQYTVEATFEGHKQMRHVALDGHDGQDVYIHWQGTPATDPFDGKPLGGRHTPG
jgi:hypothetical protein